MGKNKLSICKIFVAFLIVLLAVFAVYTVKVFRNFAEIFEDDCLSKKEIIETVNNNYGTILMDIAENDFSDTQKIAGIQEITAVGDVIDFYCGGSGFGSATNYFGFYYSPDNLPRSVWCGQTFGDVDELVPEGNGFSRRYENDDNFYYTEKIRDNFYRHEAHF